MMNFKGFGMERSWPDFKVLSRHSPVVTEENHKNLSQDRRTPGQDLSTCWVRRRGVNHSTKIAISLLNIMLVQHH